MEKEEEEEKSNEELSRKYACCDDDHNHNNNNQSASASAKAKEKGGLNSPLPSHPYHHLSKSCCDVFLPNSPKIQQVVYLL